jgi:hypothetical protein
MGCLGKHVERDDAKNLVTIGNEGIEIPGEGCGVA